MDPDVGYVWVVDAPDWRVARKPHICRRPHCYRQAVAELNRGRRAGGRVLADWWAYCGDHLYGREVRDGQVWVRVRADAPRAKEAQEVRADGC